MIKEFIIRTEDANQKDLKELESICKKMADRRNAEFYTRELQQKNPKYLKLTLIPNKTILMEVC